MKIFITAIIYALFIQTGIAQTKQMFPVDESDRDPTLAIFVRELKGAIASKDDKWIISKLDEGVMSSFGDEPGIASFLNYWTPENDSTDFWPYLSRVVHMGGAFVPNPGESGKYQFVFPYAYNLDIALEDDYFMLGIVTGQNVNLRSEPNTSSEVITRLDHHVIYYIYEEKPEEAKAVELTPSGDPAWYHITTYDKKYTGWINWQYVYSLYGPRLFVFNDPKGDWKIAAFVVGD